MIPGVRGSLLSHDALEHLIPEALRGSLGEAGRDEAWKGLRAWHRTLLPRLGPSASARMVFDQVAGPLTARLGYRPVPLSSVVDCYRAVLVVEGVTAAVLLVTPWGHDLSAMWRDAVKHGIGLGVRWCLCVSGPAVRLADSMRTYSRRFIEFDLQITLENDRAFAVMWGLLRAAALTVSTRPGEPVIDQAVQLSERHRLAVRSSLQHGVEHALTRLTRAFSTARASKRRPSLRPGQPGSTSEEEALTVIYRILFLLFAEARGLVPLWHPVFRENYTIEAMRRDVEQLPRPPGLWESLQAISRLAHRGCHAGSLRVPPFNGRLFSPAHAPLSDVLPLDDADVREAILALTTRPARMGRERIAYGDLGVEQLGGVYERLLDFQLPESQLPVAAKPGRRKATGSFYTPRSLTEYLVRRALAPLVDETAPDGILALRIVDPAMGSGAFLVAACRYLAGAYENALVRAGDATTADLTDADRAGFRRAIAQRCLYGVDLNPMAVQLGRLSLWLATLAADRPLTFLDHRLRVGNSLVGASAWDVLRQAPPAPRRGPRPPPLPLFEQDGLGGAIGAAVAIRAGLARGPGETLEQVRAKERVLLNLEESDSELRRWKRLCDIWCSGWFRDTAGRVELSAAFPALMDAVLRGRSSLPDRTVQRLLGDVDALAEARRFFHWPIEFPEVFHDEDGRALQAAGFDAVIGNPPWEMLRGDHGSAATRADARAAAAQVSDFARGAGVYRMQGEGHVNLYQLFAERALTLVRPGGRLGMILPSGFATDHGSGPLRRALFDHATVDTFQGFENRDGLFPIHRGLKFLLVTARAGGQTTTVPARFGLRRADTLDQLPDTGLDPDTVGLTRPFLHRLSGPLLVVPEIRTSRDREIVSAITFGTPDLAHPDGWQVTFGRELNATQDRRRFVEHGGGLPVIDGKHIRPFSADPRQARYYIPVPVADRSPALRRAHRQPRLAYRDVASSTNRVTLIAAIVPRGVLTTHTLFCSRPALEDDVLLFLCGMLNSFVANYIVRLQVGTHVTASLMSRLPVPRPPRSNPAFARVAALADTLQSDPRNVGAHAELQACAARLYGLSAVQLQHVLDSFPLVSVEERVRVLKAFGDTG